MSSKAEKVQYFISKIVEDAINARIAYGETDAASLRREKHNLVIEVRCRVTSTYAMMELNDIMHWKKPKSVD